MFYLFHIGKTFPVEDIFHPGKPIKVTQGEIRWIGRVGHGIHAVFGQKLLTLSAVWAGALIAHKSPITKQVNTLEFFFFKSLKPNTASHNNASWYTDRDGFQEHLPSRGILYYKGPPVRRQSHFGGILPCTYIYTYTYVYTCERDYCSCHHWKYILKLCFTYPY